MNRNRRAADLLGLLPRHLRAQHRIILHLHSDRSCDFGDQIASVLFLLAKEWIEKSGIADIMAQFAMFQKDMHTFPKRVIKDLDDLLMNERILREGLYGIGTLPLLEERRSARSLIGKLESGSNFIVSLWRPKSHHDIFGMKNRFEPGPELERNIKRWKRPLSDDHGMNKFNRDMLSISGVGAASEGKQTTSPRKSFSHGAASFSERKASREKKSSTI